MLTTARQVRLIKCAILSPGLSLRANNPDDQNTLATYGYDILPFVQQVDLYESIFDNTISGSLTLLENVGLSEYLPLVGVETLGLIFEIDDDDGQPVQFRRAFRIVALKNQMFPRNDYRLYTLQLTTHEFVLSVSSRICRAFHDISCKNAVETILTTDLGVDASRILTEEDTYGYADVVIPNYTPLQAINYFTLLAQSLDLQSANFLFFETLDGFHFTSITSLVQQKVAKIFKVDAGQISTATTVTEQTVRDGIIRVHQPQGFDLLADITSGTLRSTMLHFDILAQQYDHVEDMRYTTEFSKTKHLADSATSQAYPFYPNDFDLSVSKDVRLFTVPSNMWSSKSDYVRSANDTLPLQRMHEAVIVRNRQMHEIRHVQTLIDLPGQPDLRAGSVVTVLYPSSRTLQGFEGGINQPVWSGGTPYYSGKHLVTSVHHILTVKGPGSMEYRMNIQVNRDSLGAPLINPLQV